AFYKTFWEISTQLHSTIKAAEVMQLTVNKASELLRAKGALLRLRDPETKKFQVAAACGLGLKYMGKEPVPSQAVLTEQILERKVLIIRDLWNAPRVEYPQEKVEEGVRMILDVPMTLKYDILGVIRIYLGEEREFSESELDFMVALAQQCACALNTAQQIEAKQAELDHLIVRTDKLSALGRMAAGIAHEINNPLAGILLYSSSMRKKVPDKGPLKEGLDVVISETKRCKQIIEELLEFSRDRAPDRKRSDLNEILAKAIRIVDNEFRLRRIRLETQMASDLEEVLLDEVQVEQVFVNLLMNAVHATPEGGLVMVRSGMDRQHGNVWVEIEDNGCGIPPENIKKIFEPFYSTKSEGTGLGLSVSYGIVRNHGGDMDVLSEEGKGTRFIVEFPAAKDASRTVGEEKTNGEQVVLPMYNNN
ncbi:MAG: sensor histidine kinase, partial [Desulfobacteraceae bacterium]